MLNECNTIKELSLNSGMVELSPRIIQHIIKDLNNEDYDDEEDEDNNEEE